MTLSNHVTGNSRDDTTLLFTVDPGTHSATITDLLVTDYGSAIVTVGMDKRTRWWDLDQIENTEQGAEAKPLTMLGRIGPGADGAIEGVAVHRPSGIVVTSARSELSGGSVLRLRVPWSDRWQTTFRWSGSIADLAISPDGTYLVVASVGGGDTSPTDDSDERSAARLEIFRFDELQSAAADSIDPIDRSDSTDPSGPVDATDPSDPFGYPDGPLPAAELLNQPEPLYRHPLIIGPARVAIGPEVGGNITVAVTPTFVGQPQLFELSGGGFVEWTADRGEGDIDGDDVSRGLPAVGLEASVAITENHIAIAGENTGLTVLDRASRLITSEVPAAGGGSPVGVAFSPDGSLLVVGSRAGARSEITVHDIHSGAAVVGRRSYDDNAVAVGFRSDYRVVTAGGSRFSIHTWDPLTSEPQAGDRFVDGAGQVVDAVGISGSQIGFGNPDPVRPDEPRGEAPTLARRFDLDLLALVPGAEEPGQTVSLEEFVRAVHRLPTGEELELDQGQVFVEPAGFAIAEGGGFSSDQATSFGFTANQQVIVGRRSGALTMFSQPVDIGRSSGETMSSGGGSGVGIDRMLPTRRLVGHVSAVLDLAAGDQWLVTAGRDQVMRLWSRDRLTAAAAPEAETTAVAVLGAEPVEPALSLFVTATNEWVIWSPSGYYASSLNGDRYISYHYNRGEAAPARAYSGDQFVKNLYRPDVIRSILELGSETEALEALKVPLFSVETCLPPEVRIVDAMISFSSDGPDICEFRFDVIDASRPTTKIIVLQNGVPALEIDVADQPGEIIDTNGPVRRYDEVIFLEPQDNKLSVVAENEVARSAAAEETVNPVVVLPAESVSLPPMSGGEVSAATVEAIELADVVEGDLTRGRVTGAEISIAIEVVEGEEPLTITATRNDETVWVGETGPGVGFDGQLDVPLHRGYNDIEVSVGSKTADGVLFSGQIEVTPRYTINQNENAGNGTPSADPGGQELDPEVGLPGTTEPSSEPQSEPPVELPEETEPDQERIHLVVEGETLRLLAEHYYGHESRYPLIFEANPQLVDLDRLLPGTALVIPEIRVGVEGDGSTDEIDLAGWKTAKEVSAKLQRLPVDGAAVASGAANLPSSDPASVQEFSGPAGGGRKGTGGNPRDLPPATDSDVPNLYLLSVGVSNLASRSEGFENLSWPGDDAAAISERFLACEGDQFGQVHQIGLGSRNVIEGTDATKANIEQAVADLAAAVKDRAAKKRADRVGTTDVTVVFFSGHGMSRVATEGEQEGLFLIPHDYDQDRWQETSVSLLDVAETLCTLPKTELIIFIDACRSGFAGTDFAQRIKPEQFGKRVEAISPRTIYVLSSTARDLDSWEFGLKYPYNASASDRQFVGHGLFTHAILKRMDEADRANRGLSVLELGASMHRQFETWRSWKAFSDIDVRQDPWYQFHRSVRHFEFYKKSR